MLVLVDMGVLCLWWLALLAYSSHVISYLMATCLLSCYGLFVRIHSYFVVYN
jgi:hypothetical protein